MPWHGRWSRTQSTSVPKLPPPSRDRYCLCPLRIPAPSSQTIPAMRHGVECVLGILRQPVPAVFPAPQTEQMERIADNLETLDFNLKQATKIIRRYGRQVATDKCILCLMGLLVLAIVAVVVVKVSTCMSLCWCSSARSLCVCAPQ